MVADFATAGAGSDVAVVVVVAVAVAAAADDVAGLAAGMAAAAAAEVVVEADKRRVVSIALYQAGCTAIVSPAGRGTRRRSCGTLARCSGSA